MDFDDYQKKTSETRIKSSFVPDFVFMTIALSGEAGEVTEKIKKVIRDDNGVISEEKKEEIEKELGDVLWCLAQLASDLDMSLENIAQKNLEKALSRKERGMIHGAGDNR